MVNFNIEKVEKFSDYLENFSTLCFNQKRRIGNSDTPDLLEYKLSYNYLIVTLAPCSSSFVLISSASSSLDTASFTTLGAPSTTAFASFNPKPVISRTALITLTFAAPTSVNSTSNSVFSSAASAPPAAATTTPCLLQIHQILLHML